EVVGAVARLHDAFESMAAEAAQQAAFLLIGPWDAGNPLAVRELRGEVLGLAQLEIDRRARVGDNGGGRRTIEVVAHRAHAQGIMTRPEPARGETVAALLVGHDRDGNG